MKMPIYLMVFAWSLVVSIWVPANAAGTVAKVAGDRVNLRARPLPEAEVVGQLAAADTVTICGEEGDWVEVRVPEKVDVWVHRDFVKDAVVTAPKLQVRSGPGINHSVVGLLNHGETVSVRGEFGEWLRIAPPVSCSVWVNRSLLKMPESAPPKTPEASTSGPVAQAPVSADRDPAPVPKTLIKPSPPPARATPSLATEPMPPPTVSKPTLSAAPRVAPPPGLNLIPLEGQGRRAEYQGELNMSFISFGAPSRFYLAMPNPNNAPGKQVLCFVYGNSAQLRQFTGDRLAIRGREFWVRGCQQPVLVPEEITPIAMRERDPLPRR